MASLGAQCLSSNMQTWGGGLQEELCPSSCVWPAAHLPGSRATEGEGGLPAGAGGAVGWSPLHVNTGCRQVRDNVQELRQDQPTPAFGTTEKNGCRFPSLFQNSQNFSAGRLNPGPGRDEHFGEMWFQLS